MDKFKDGRLPRRAWLSSAILFPFTGLTTLVGQQEGHLACNKLGVGGDHFTGALHVLWLQLSPPSPSSLALIKSRKRTFWYWLTQIHLENDHYKQRGERGRDRVQLTETTDVAEIKVALFFGTFESLKVQPSLCPYCYYGGCV